MTDRDYRRLNDKRQPRRGQLQLGGMDRIVDGLMTNGSPNTVRPQAGGNPVERVTRGDLRLPAPVDKRSGAALQRGARSRAFRAQVLEACAIDRLEWKRILKTRLGRGVETARRLQRPLARLVDAVALKTDRDSGLGARDSACAALARRSAERAKAAGRAHDLWPLPFQLAAWKRNPFFFSNFL